jgi:NAD(P) transhydrogenase
MQANEYDLVVIGSGPAGQKGAICAAKMRKKVAIIDRRLDDGRGLRSYRDDSEQGAARGGALPERLAAAFVLWTRLRRERPDHDVGPGAAGDSGDDAGSGRDQGAIARNYVTALEGDAHFADPHTIEIVNEDGVQQVRGEKILIACGTRPAHIDGIPVDGKRIFDSDQVHCLEEIPRELIVVGAGIIGLEYASMFAALGVKVTLLDQRPALLDFVDREIIESLCFQLRQLGTVFRLGEKVVSVGFDEERDKVFAVLESGKKVRGQALLYTIGRKANSDKLKIEAAGLTADESRQIGGKRKFSDRVPHIYAAGDVIGFPALASTSMEQGRLAGCHMFGKPSRMLPNLIPYGIYTIPEISMVGAPRKS